MISGRSPPGPPVHRTERLGGGNDNSRETEARGVLDEGILPLPVETPPARAFESILPTPEGNKAKLDSQFAQGLSSVAQSAQPACMGVGSSSFPLTPAGSGRIRTRRDKSADIKTTPASPSSVILTAVAPPVPANQHRDPRELTGRPPLMSKNANSDHDQRGPEGQVLPELLAFQRLSRERNYRRRQPMALKGLSGPLGLRVTSQPFSEAEEEGQCGPWPPWRLAQI